MRFIDADALRERMYSEVFDSDSDMQKWDSGCWLRYKLFEKVLRETPTADAVLVVRCKDCKFYVKHGLFGEIQKWCKRLCDEFDRSMAIVTNDDDFCSYGERREVQRNFNASNVLDALETEVTE